MAGACLPGDLPSLNDRSVPLEVVLGRGVATKLVKDLGTCSSIEVIVEKLDQRLVLLPRITEVQQTIAELVKKRGQLALADFADAAGVGDRQLRRCCHKHSGLAPKQLARMLRFRHASMLLRRGVKDIAGLALDCGYYDQAHLVRDFRALAGTSPARFMRQHSR
jgi:transcriptional regulator GlxA family with amidase domain